MTPLVLWRWIERAFVIVALVSITTVMAVAVYWFVVEPVPLLRSGDVSVTDEDGLGRTRFTPGEVFFVHRTLCTRKPVVMRTIRRFVNALVYQLATVDLHRPSGCYESRFALEVPHLPPGRYTYEASAEVQTNPIRRDVIELDPIAIEILGVRQPGQN